jgi:uracil-DNA glycosylase family 4
MAKKTASNEPTPQSFADELERFVKEQAAVYGEVISYVPMPRADAGVATTAELVVLPSAASSNSVLSEKLAAFSGESWSAATSLAMLESEIKDCRKCRLGSTRINLVFGKGAEQADIVVIGEAPGADEDAKGEPFIGRAGQLLTKMLEAIQLDRKDIYITNILKSRPPNNRDPKPDEVEACEPYLWKQLALIQPKMILCLGRIAGSTLLKQKTDTLGKMRGNVYDYNGIKVMVTYHPAALLRNPDWKHGAWEDLQKFRRMYDEMLAA